MARVLTIRVAEASVENVLPVYQYRSQLINRITCDANIFRRYYARLVLLEYAFLYRFSFVFVWSIRIHIRNYELTNFDIASLS